MNIGSRAWPVGDTPAYTASKAGIVGLTRGVATQLGNWNVRANAVAPGYVDTELSRKGRSGDALAKFYAVNERITKLPRYGTAEDIVNADYFLAAHPSVSFGPDLSP